jgi:hypothetical protein
MIMRLFSVSIHRRPDCNDCDCAALCQVDIFIRSSRLVGDMQDSVLYVNDEILLQMDHEPKDSNDDGCIAEGWHQHSTRFPRNRLPMTRQGGNCITSSVLVDVAAGRSV